MSRAAFLLATLLLWPVAEAHANDLLIDQFEHPVSPSELGGHWLLVYFGYSQCPDVCPAALARMTQVLTRLGADGTAVLPLFITLDPAHDTPQVLRRYVAHFSPRLRALTGRPAAIADAARTFGVPWSHHSADAGIDHGLIMYLIGPDGSLVDQFHPHTADAAIAQRMSAHLRGRRP